MDLDEEGCIYDSNTTSSSKQTSLWGEDWTPPGPIQEIPTLPKLVHLGRLNRKQVMKMQINDETLSDLWTAAREDPGSDFDVRKGQLSRVVTDSWGKESWLLVLPKQLREAAWEAAHTSPLSGHLGSKRLSE